MGHYENVVAVILGGGAGTRLYPLTRERSKPAVPLGGKYRLIDVPVSNCINSEIMHIFVLTQYNSASLNRHISTTYRFSAFSSGFVEVLAAEQTKDNTEWFQGTADAVRQMMPHLRDWRIDTVLILSGDHLYRMDYRDFLDRHFWSGADLTVSVIPCRQEEAGEYGLLKTDADGAIIEFKEKPKGDALEEMRVDTTAFGLSPNEALERPFLASMGIYVFKYDKLVELLGEDDARVDFGKEIIPSAITKYNVQAHLFKDYWEDIGTIRSFYEANLDLARPLPKFNFFDASSPIYTRSRNLPPSKVHDCTIDDTMISEGCILNGITAKNSIIGLRSRIGTGAQIENSIIMGSDFFEGLDDLEANIGRNVPHLGIDQNSVIRNAIVDKNVRIGKNVQLINADSVQQYDSPDGAFYIRDSIIIIPKNAVIPDGTII
ncbi:MAG: glucose-1-phosphate adenylyltransferase [Chloracidobacterium sp.]|nr:glucose-1-phosphate adenylyltransferase [Chloracidobacterium sp.]MCC6824685.1 glucose-1-phosphate adenylyltransferase [Acidobacteriota bacterium]MCO5332772.1 glucose-1-phosphate adenylyltransferase [Pyrinomonadaceae bacterium]